jgi:hypothetical protein
MEAVRIVQARIIAAGDSMARTRTVRAGDLIDVPFGEGQVAVGIVLHTSREFFSRSMLVGFYDRVFPAAAAIDVTVLGRPFIATPQYVSKRMVREGWPVIGHSEELLAAMKLPELRVAYELYRGDTFIRRLHPDELSNYPSLGVQGDGYVEDVLRDHFLKP